MTQRCVVAIFSVAMMAMGAAVASGQNYPNKPIRIVTNDPGGGNDFSSRLIAQGLSGSLGHQVIVQNRGGTVISAQTVATARPDGYTLLVNGSAFWVAPLLQKMPYDPVRDFSPITVTTISPNVLVAHPSLAVQSVKELIALAKAKPGEINYASASGGGSSQISGELFKTMAGVNLVGIPYKSAGPALNDVISGRVPLMFASAAAVTAHIKAGRLRALAVTSAQPSALFPGLPTIAASGVAEYESGSRQGIWAPAQTPATIIKLLNQEIVQVLSQSDVKERLLSIGSEAAPSSPEQLAIIIKSEMNRVGKLVKDAGIHAD